MFNREISHLILGLILGGIVTTGVFALLVRQDETGDAPRKTTLRLAHSLPEASPSHKALEWMAKDLTRRSGGAMEVLVFPSGQLGSETDVLEQMQRGALALTRTSTAALEGFAPEFAVFGTPYLFDDDRHFWQVLEGRVGQDLLTLGADYGLRGLGYYNAGARSFYTRHTPIETPDDLRGLKIRTQRSKTAMDMVDTLGASATPMPFGELYTGLQQGIVDGAENNPPSYYDTRHYEVAPFYSLDEHTRVPDIILVSEMIWNRLDPRERQWLREAIVASMDEQRRLWQEYETEVLRTLEEEGVTILRPEKEPFKDAVEPMLKSLQGTPVGDLVDQIRQVER
jgi:tripartite ATP-independent transporter DctP family solute receptor